MIGCKAKTRNRRIIEMLSSILLYTCPRVNPEVAVLCSPSLFHFSSVTCLATSEWVDLISGKGAIFSYKIEVRESEIINITTTKSHTYKVLNFLLVVSVSPTVCQVQEETQFSLFLIKIQRPDLFRVYSVNDLLVCQATK